MTIRTRPQRYLQSSLGSGLAHTHTIPTTDGPAAEVTPGTAAQLVTETLAVSVSDGVLSISRASLDGVASFVTNVPTEVIANTVITGVGVTSTGAPTF